MERRRDFQNPIIRDKVYFKKFSHEGESNETIIIVEQAPGGDTGLHYHNAFDEHFKVIEGTLSLQVGKTIHHLNNGQTAVAPQKAMHRFFNSSQQNVKFEVTVKPGHAGFENALKIAYGLADDGKVTKQGRPLKFWQMGAMLYLADTNLPGFLSLVQPLLYRIGKKAIRDGRFERELKKYTM